MNFLIITFSYDILSVSILIRCNFRQDTYRPKDKNFSVNINVGGLSLEVKAARVKHSSVKLIQDDKIRAGF